MRMRVKHNVASQNWEKTGDLLSMVMTKGFHRFTLRDDHPIMLEYGVVGEDGEFEVEKDPDRDRAFEYYNDGSDGNKRIAVRMLVHGSDPVCYFGYSYQTFDEIPSLQVLCKRTILFHRVYDYALPRLLRTYVNQALEPAVGGIVNYCNDLGLGITSWNSFQNIITRRLHNDTGDSYWLS